MKKLILSAAVCFALASCGDDDNNQAAPVASPGVWKLTAVTLDDAYDINGDGTATKNLALETGCFNNSSITFSNAIATLSVQDVDITFDGTPTNGQYAFECEPAEVFTFSYNEAGSTVYLENSNGDILPLTRSGNTLTAYFEDGTTIPILVQGNLSFIDVGTTFTFTKQ